MRLAVISRELCRPSKCGRECIAVCPINRAGKQCVWLAEWGAAAIDETLCIGCALCCKRCPFSAIDVVRTPEQLVESPIHRFGPNLFTLFRLPFPVEGEVVGLLGPNGVGKTTALRILSGELKPNLGAEQPVEIRQLIRLFRGTELQAYLEALARGTMRTVVKPQTIDYLAKIDSTVSELLTRYDERAVMSQIARQLQLDLCLDRQLKQLSGGELQRTAIAIAAARVADIYYFDEPASYLDVRQRLTAAKLIRELATGAAVVVVEHDLATLDYLADRIHVFYGVPGVYGIVSKPYSCRVGINVFLDGYIREDNVRFRPEPIVFGVGRPVPVTKPEIWLSWSDNRKQLGTFSLNVSAGHVFAGEILAVFGANALGKTTFARILAGELKPDSGTITKAVKISYKPQYITIDFSGTVAELLVKVAGDIYSEGYRAEILRPLRLERLLELPLSRLSGGELQRVAIAVCLSSAAELYLLDEPSAFLDSEQRLAVAKMIRRICESRHCSAVVIDHDLLFLSYLADRAMLFSGEPGLAGSTAQFGLQEGLNRFLRELDITFRADPDTQRPRANKPGSRLDREQKAAGRYFIF